MRDCLSVCHRRHVTVIDMCSEITELRKLEELDQEVSVLWLLAS